MLKYIQLDFRQKNKCLCFKTGNFNLKTLSRNILLCLCTFLKPAQGKVHFAICKIGIIYLTHYLHNPMSCFIVIFVKICKNSFQS